MTLDRLLRPVGEDMLERCKDEPIHIPGSIQPHGMLIAVSDVFSVQCVSENFFSYFQLEKHEVLDQPLSEVLIFKDSKIYHELKLQTQTQDRICHHIHLKVAGTFESFNLLVHRNVQNILILELEAHSFATPPEGSLSFYQKIRSSISEIKKISKISELHEFATREIKRLTGFERVMVYHFQPDWCGKVIAESKEEHLESYLDLHYPASDIPAQARALYTKNWHRLISEAAYVPSPLISLEPIALDLSQALFRGVSPVHCEYLANMNVRASMSVSLLSDKKLWGLIACHHSTQKILTYETREACEFIGQLISLRISARFENEDEKYQAKLKKLLENLAYETEINEKLSETVMRNSTDFLSLVDAGGAVLVSDQDFYSTGMTPTQEEIKDLSIMLAQKFESNKDLEVFSSSFLSEHYPPAAKWRHCAAGIVAFCIPHGNNNFVIWFRPEVARTVKWAGNPRENAAYIDKNDKLHPRKSFLVWQETVHLQATPWTDSELNIVREFKNFVLGIDLEKQFAKAQEALRVRDEFLSIASHELKTPLTSLKLQTQTNLLYLKTKELSEKQIQSMTKLLSSSEKQLNSLTRLIDDLLDVSKINSGKMSLHSERVKICELAGEVIERLSEHSRVLGNTIELEATREIECVVDRFKIEQVVTNLLSNALKFNPGCNILVSITHDKDWVFITVQDFGNGIAKENLARIFERFERGVESNSPVSGLGLGLYIVKNIVDFHNGQIFVKSEIGVGTEFTVQLPLKAAHL